jgi:hypothetical protein
MICFHHPLNKQIDLMLMNFDASFHLYSQNHPLNLQEGKSMIKGTKNHVK